MKSAASSTAIAVALGIAVSVAVATFTTTKSVIERVTFWFRSYVLVDARIPIAVLKHDEAVFSDAQIYVDAEGMVDCDIHVKRGIVEKIVIQKASSERVNSWVPRIDCRKAIVFPSFIDAHTHMIKTETVPRNRNGTGTITEAKDVREPSDVPRWKSNDDTFRRMDFAVRCALHYGTKALRTHLDGTQVEDPEVVASTYDAYDRIKKKYAGKIRLQGVANLYLPLWSSREIAEPFAKRAKTHADTVLGAYCGNPDGEQTQKHLEDLFKMAKEVCCMPCCGIVSFSHNRALL